MGLVVEGVRAEGVMGEGRLRDLEGDGVMRVVVGAEAKAHELRCSPQGAIEDVHLYRGYASTYGRQTPACLSMCQLRCSPHGAIEDIHQ